VYFGRNQHVRVRLAGQRTLEWRIRATRIHRVQRVAVDCDARSCRCQGLCLPPSRVGFAERASELLLAALAGGVIAIPICMLLFAMIFPRRARTLNRSLLKHVHEVGPSKDYGRSEILQPFTLCADRDYDEAGYVIDTHEQAGHFGDVAFRAAEANEFSPRHLCDDARKRGLAAAWRSVEIHRWQTICFDCAAQKFARCENVFLPDKLIERARPHPCGERRGGVCSFNLVCSLE